MAAAAVRATSPIPVPRTPVSGAARTVEQEQPGRRVPSAGRAVAYQRVLHQMVRREWRLLGDLATWAPAGEAVRTAALARHAELIGRILLHHHEVEREAVWPALLRTLPADQVDAVRAAVDDWTTRCARVDRMVRNVCTAGRQWQVTGNAAARDAFALACRDLADAVDAQTASEEAFLLPLLDEHLEAGHWAAIARSSHCRLSANDQLFVLGLALEDSSADDRARLLSGLSPATRLAWRTHGRRNYRAAVVRLRGAPPAR